MHTRANEETLVRSSQSGDAEAFTRLVALHEDRLLRQAMALVRNEQRAVELTHETLIEAWQAIHRFNFTCRFNTWLYAILRNRYRQHAHKARRRQEIPFTIDPSASDTNNAEVDEEELAHLVETLSEKHREVIQLRFYADARLEEMAVVMGCSVGTVKSRLHYALKALRKKIEKQ